MLLFSLVWALCASSALAAFGYTDEGTYWTISSGKNLVIEVSKTNGDIQSILFNVRAILGRYTMRFVRNRYLHLR